MIRTRVRQDPPHHSVHARLVGALRARVRRGRPSSTTTGCRRATRSGRSPSRATPAIRERASGSYVSATTSPARRFSRASALAAVGATDAVGARRDPPSLCPSRIPSPLPRERKGMASERILELLRRPVDADEYQEIREALEAAFHGGGQPRPPRPDLDAHGGLRLRGRGHRVPAGKATTGPRASTRSCSAPSPDIHFALEFIVIGPQGVCEEARVTATHQGRWLEHEPTGRRLEWRNAIFFPLGCRGTALQGGDGVHGSRPLSGSRRRLSRYLWRGADRAAGSGGHARAARRRPAAVRLREGTQRQLLRSDVGLVDLEEIFVSHFHADHYLGLPGMLKTFALRGRDVPLTVYGPRGLRSLLGALRRVFGT